MEQEEDRRSGIWICRDFIWISFKVSQPPFKVLTVLIPDGTDGFLASHARWQDVIFALVTLWKSYYTSVSHAALIAYNWVFGTEASVCSRRHSWLQKKDFVHNVGRIKEVLYGSAATLCSSAETLVRAYPALNKETKLKDNIWHLRAGFFITTVSICELSNMLKEHE